jgi:hydroxyacylglutathione hydrolase
VLITGFPSGSFQANCFVVAARPGEPCVVIDPGEGADAALPAVLAEHGVAPVAVLLTHGHLDHTAAAAEICRTHGIPAYIHPGDEYMLDDPLAALSPELRAALRGLPVQGRRPATVLPASDLGEPGPAGLPLTALHVPGHTPGSVVYRLAGDDDRPDVLFTGDTLFAGSIGRTDLVGGSLSQELDSIASAILTLPDESVVAPGHGPTTTVGAERTGNPFLTEHARPSRTGRAHADQD